MPRYKCLNKGCSQYGEVILVHSTRLIFKDTEVVDEKAECPECKEKRTTIKRDGWATAFRDKSTNNIPL